MLQQMKNKVKLLRIKGQSNLANKIAKLIKQYEDSKITEQVLKQYFYSLIK